MAMGSEEPEYAERLLQLEGENPHLQNESKGPYTGDGSVDLSGNPVLKNHTGNWRACPFILGTECCERLAYYGISKNLVTYLTKELHQGNFSAARNVTTWQGTCYLTPLIGAFVADSYWGRYRTVAVFSTIYFIGMLSLTVSASVPALKPPHCIGFACPEPSTFQSAIFFFSLYLIALGTGGIKPCVSSFGADQFDDTDPRERPGKGSFFNWFYFCINIGAFISGTFLVWIQDNRGWGLGYGIPTLFMALAVGSFLSGSKLYRFQKPGGSPLTRMCQVVVACLKKWDLKVPEDSSHLYELEGSESAIQGSRKLEHSAHFNLLDKAAIISTLGTEREDLSNPWSLCTVTQVEEFKILIQMFPIWATTIVFSSVYSQTSLFLEQGMVLNKQTGSFSIPPASLSTFTVISVLICIPIYDRLLIPTVRKLTGEKRGFTELQRIGIGLFVSILAMLSATLVEIRRLQIAESEGLVHEKVVVPMSILWQIPQYFLIGVGEVFTAIGQVEFFYEQSPDAMRSLCSALALVTASLGSYLSSLILTVVASLTTRGGNPGWIPDNLNEGHLDRFFLLIAGLSFLNLVVFVWCALRYESKKAS
ncbi:uncharacterized protein A4U43_C08F14800 [Asparagus officinalis]|nr:uncharacterized protein A4U43_C08F14800 [Asparagus officinalis]